MVSTDQVEWQEVAVGSDAHPYATGWSEINVNSTDSWRYASIKPGRTSCMFAELQFVGVLVPTGGPENCDVNVNVTANTGAVASTASLSAGYSYSAADTPEITSVSPSFGTAAGGTLLTVTGVCSPRLPSICSLCLTLSVLLSARESCASSACELESCFPCQV